MIDIYGVIDLHRRRRIFDISNPFRKYQFYDFDHVEQQHVTNNSKVFCLYRKRQSIGYCCQGHLHLFVFGYILGCKKLCESLSKNCTERLMAEDVLVLYGRYGLELVDYIRGSFIIIIYDEEKNNVVLISDHLNVLPVYYSYENGLFVFSSAIKPILDSRLVDMELDDTAIAEFCIFDYTLGNRTFYKDVKQIDYAQILIANENGLLQHRYFAVSDLFHNELYDKRESVEMLGSVLHDNIRSYVGDANKFLLALTGGFDCRMNLALVDRKSEDYLCYSYGMSGSRQIEIPTEIAKLLKLNYTAILLDEDFRKEYADCALRAVFYSDGTAPILRANYPYAFGQLNRFSDIAVTGLFGSEVMRPIRNLGIQINKNSESVFMSNDFDGALTDVLRHEENEGYVIPEILRVSSEEIRDYLRKTFLSTNREKLTNLYHFFIAEGIRKYFMQEIRIERIYIETRFPYFDIDFVKAIFSTPYAGIYNGALKESPIGRRNAQSLYAHVIAKFKPELGQIQVDRGYRPNDLLSPLWFYKILPGYIRGKLYYRKKGDDTFDAERWTDTIFSEERALMKKKTDIFPGTMYNKYLKGENIRDNYRFSRIFSLKYWFEHDGT